MVYIHEKNCGITPFNLFLQWSVSKDLGFQNILPADASIAPLANTCCRAVMGGGRRLQACSSARSSPPHLTQRQSPAGVLASRVPFNNAEDDHLTPLESPSIFLKRNAPRATPAASTSTTRPPVELPGQRHHAATRRNTQFGGHPFAQSRGT